MVTQRIEDFNSRSYQVSRTNVKIRTSIMSRGIISDGWERKWLEKNVELHFKRVIQIWAPSPFHKLRLSLSHKAPGIVESRLSLSQSSGRN